MFVTEEREGWEIGTRCREVLKDLEKMFIETPLRSQRLVTSWFHSLGWKWARRRKRSECNLTVHLTVGSCDVFRTGVNMDMTFWRVNNALTPIQTIQLHTILLH